VVLVREFEAPDSWAQFQDALKAGASKGNWDTWLSRLRPDFVGEAPVLIAPSEFHLRWVLDKHGELIDSSYRDAYGFDARPSYRVAEPEPIEQVFPMGEEEVDEEIEMRSISAPGGPSTNLISRYRFESFVVGQSNRFAWAAAMAVAEQPGAHYNPLFIYGGAGLGKTHLLNAVGHQALEMYPNLVVRYISSENFLNDFIDSIRRKRPDDFKHRYRGVDIPSSTMFSSSRAKSRSSRSSSTPSTPSMSRASRW
jgi:chromosomal replication initiator protein